ncbi:hypothetical protein [Sphingopyxis macrogoltabida]|uniref:Uncharacterized protein n=1 Tax=Sphingopyxis macrogoltabida TaxID=33050 RepID=A0AAC9AVQ9_SPHMC|nr:hypothetical protein [Sphingopyxis macrogoltabida]ALJ14261.1 hypothetical protein LH19_15430 [Sphingopyxis macrogoltabida]AMU90526.1 hypothetical protein ATM17_16000 [Sphingopyxis macrogoltabida]
MNMIAKERLLLTADKSRLVADGDPEGATLYCTPGTEIPDSAAKLFGLVDGRLGEGTVLVVEADEGGLIRVRIFDTIADEAIDVANMRFTHEFRLIGENEIDEGGLLEILKEVRLDVQAALISPEKETLWVSFPGRDKAIEALQEHIDDDIAAGRPHLPVGDATAEKVEKLKAMVLGGSAPSGSDPGNDPATGAKEALPGGDKEKAPGQDKEKKPDGDKGAGSGTKGAAPDDLTLVKGVGPKVAEGFAKADITTFVQIAAIDPASPPAVEGTRATTNWAGIVESAKEIVAAAAAAEGSGDDAASGDGGGVTGDAGQKAD